MTKKEKQEAAKQIIKGLLADSEMKANDLIDRAAELFTQRFGDEKTDNANDVKGRIGSILDVMKKDADVLFEGGRYALKKEVQIEKAQQEPKKRTRKTKAKTEEKEEKTQKIEELLK